MRIPARTLLALGFTVAACSPSTGVRAPVGRDAPATFAASGSPAVLAAAMTYPAVIAEDGPPLSLTASDGTGLELVGLDARAVVDGPLAFTELHLSFANPQD